MKTDTESKGIRWDEDNIAEHDKLRGTRQKINEPNTPYNFESQSDLSDYESGDSGSKNSVRGQSPGTDKGRQELETVIRAVRLRLPDQSAIDKERTERWDDSEREDTAANDHFKKKRAQHYNEYQMLSEWKRHHSIDEDDLSDEGNNPSVTQD